MPSGIASPIELGCESSDSVWITAEPAAERLLAETLAVSSDGQAAFVAGIDTSPETRGLAAAAYAADTGTLLWQAETPVKRPFGPGSMAVGSERVYVAATDADPVPAAANLG